MWFSKDQVTNGAGVLEIGWGRGGELTLVASFDGCHGSFKEKQFVSI